MANFMGAHAANAVGASHPNQPPHVWGNEPAPAHPPPHHGGAHNQDQQVGVARGVPGQNMPYGLVPVNIPRGFQMAPNVRPTCADLLYLSPLPIQCRHIASHAGGTKLAVTLYQSRHLVPRSAGLSVEPIGNSDLPELPRQSPPNMIVGGVPALHYAQDSDRDQEDTVT